MATFKKEYVLIGSLIALALFSRATRLIASSPNQLAVNRVAAPSAVAHEPFVVSSSDSSDDNIHIGSIAIPIPDFTGLFGGSISPEYDSSEQDSPEHDAENDILTEAAINSALPDRLKSRIAELRPFIKILVRIKKSSPRKEEQDLVGALKRASSQQGIPVPTDLPDEAQELASVRRVAFHSDDSLEEHLHTPSLNPEIQRERITIQQLLLEASQAALASKEYELERRAKLIKEKEEKLEHKMSKKYAAGIASVASLFTAIVGTLTAYYSSKQ